MLTSHAMKGQSARVREASAVPPDDINAGLVLAAAAALLLSVKIVSVKLLYRHGLDAVDVIALRMLFAAPLFAVVALWTWRSRPRPGWRDLLQIGGLGLIGFYGASMLDLMGLQYISPALERVILFLTPAAALILGKLLLGRRVAGRQWLSMALAYSGILLMFWHEVRLDGGTRTVLGAALVAASAVLYAVYLLLSERVMWRLGTLRAVALVMLVSCAASLVQYAVLRPLPALFEQTAPVWGLSLLNGTVGTALPVFMTMIAVKRIGAGHAAQAGMIGPGATLILAWWLLDDPLSMAQLAGASLVTAAILLLSTRSGRARMESS